jgi:catalase
MPVGKMVLNRNPNNFFAEVEQQLSVLPVSFLA